MIAEIPFRVGEWLKSDTIKVSNWVGNVYLECLREENPVFHPCVESLKNFIESDDEVFKLFETAFAEVPLTPPYDRDVMGNPQIRDYKMFLKIMNRVITIPPRYENNDFVGFPIYAIINWCMYTPAGHILFLHPKLNEHFKIIMNEWAIFLRSNDSRLYMTEDAVDGWFGSTATSKLFDVNGEKIAFEKLFKCDVTKPYYGYDCWDAYFTRQFIPSQRPVIDGDNDDIIVNPCESAPYKIAHNVQKVDEFWIKGQPYSLSHMLQDTEDTEYFAGGTVFQAYLSAMNYHRWHSPVNGKIVKTKTIDGAFYAACPSVGFDASGCQSQEYLTEVATRSLVFIQCNSSKLGLICFMAVGMGEVSTCEVTVSVGDDVKKGDQLGMFHFGGSTYCLIFGPQVKLLFDLGENNEPGLASRNVPLNKNIIHVL